MDSKKTIIFLHGWGNSSEVFIPLSYYLKNDFSIFAPDLPGFGRAPIEKPMALKDYADFVREFIKDNNIDEPIIVGHSFGGAVATKLAILHPEIASKLILVGASAIRESNFKIKLTEKSANILKKILPKKIHPFILKFLGLDNSDYARIENPYLKETFKIAIKENLAPELSLIKVPTLVIWGEKDTETPLKHGSLIAQLIPDAKISIIKNTGHHVFLEKPDEFAKIIKRIRLMIPLKNQLYLLQLEEYDLRRFDEWLKCYPNKIVLEKKGRLNWTSKARALFVLAKIFGIKNAVLIFSPIDWLIKKIFVFMAGVKIKRMANLMSIGITGSYGKTTTKDAISHVLIHEYKTLKTEGNYNTLLGIARTILQNLKSEHKIFICEMAAYQSGDIKEITGLVRPKIGIVTAIGPMHFERFGSMENILKTKLELIESLPKDGVGFLPKELESQIKNYRFSAKIEFFSSQKELFIKIGKIFGLNEEEILGRLETMPPTQHRQQIIKAPGDMIIIDDTYNSNPAGFIFALETLKNTGAQRKILVTPGMIELGEKQFELNKNAARSAAKTADYVIVVGKTNKFALEEGLKEEFKDDFANKVFWAPDLDSAKKKLSEIATTKSAILLENDLPDHYF